MVRPAKCTKIIGRISNIAIRFASQQPRVCIPLTTIRNHPATRGGGFRRWPGSSARARGNEAEPVSEADVGWDEWQSCRFRYGHCRGRSWDSTCRILMWPTRSLREILSQEGIRVSIVCKTKPNCLTVSLSCSIQPKGNSGQAKLE